MVKQADKSNEQGARVRGQGGGNPDAYVQAEELLDDISRLAAALNAYKIEADAELKKIADNYNKYIDPLKKMIEEDDAQLIRLMKANKVAFFGSGDVLKLTHGALIHESGFKVKIPRNALDKCEELGFTEIIKIAKSLDREAVEKWPDAKLLLIGAERKPSETFKYEVKK